MGFLGLPENSTINNWFFRKCRSIFAKEQKYRFSGYCNGGVITSLTLALLKENST